MQNKLSVFNFKNTSVRTVVIDEQVWFVASDIAKALDYAEAKDMTRVLDADEQGRHIVPTPSGDQEMIVVNESGMYHAVLKSRKPEAKPFRKWVTSEVLPAIRKTGQYEATPYAVNPGDTLTKEQSNTLRSMLTEACARLPKEKQKAFMMQGWSKLKAHFKTEYRKIPSAEFSEAVSIVARHVVSGEYLPREEFGSIRQTVTRWADQISASNDYPADIFLPLVLAVIRKNPSACEPVLHKMVEQRMNDMAIGRCLLNGLPARRLSAEVQELGALAGAATSIVELINRFCTIADEVRALSNEMSVGKMFAKDLSANLVQYREKIKLRANFLDSIQA